MNLPKPPAAYDTTDQTQIRTEIEAADGANQKRNANFDIGKNMLILTSPNGTRYNITVSNAGALVVTAL